MSTPKILLTGASGGLGSRVLYHLLNTFHIAPALLQISTPRSNPTSTNPDSIIVRHGDFLDPSTLHSAFADNHVLFLVSYPSIARSLRVEAHKNAIDAAVRAGMKHIVYTSLGFADDSSAAVMQAHLDTAEYLRHTCARAGVDWTVLKEGIYSESYPLYLGFFDAKALMEEKTREVLVPKTEGQGVAWVARDELGEATARVLADIADSLAKGQKTDFNGKTILLCGPKAFSLRDVSSKISAVLGWEGDGALKVREVSEDEFVRHYAEKRGGGSEQEEFVRQWASTYPAIAKGELAVLDPALERILGRLPKDFDKILPRLLTDIAGAGASVDQYAK